MSENHAASTPAGPALGPWLPFAAVRETHSAVVILLGDRAYKVKKPVDLGFLDFTSLAQREQVCHREVELNRRLSPDVYLGVYDVHDPDGTVIEHLVVMRRMPESRRLSELLRTGADLRADLHRIAGLVASFHHDAERREDLCVAGTVDALSARWSDNLDVLRAAAVRILDPAQVDAAERLSRDYLAGRRALFDKRLEQGRVLDGHGDLLAEDIFCLDDGPRILDCLEFDDALRYVDGIDDAGFLAMDLEHLGHRDAADAFIGDYLLLSGDDPPRSLIDHYIGYRAGVRAKVACIRADQGDQAAAEDARKFLALAVEHLSAATVRLILVGGAPGTGKSTLANALAEARGMSVIASDVVRKELAGVDPHTSMAAAFGRGIYDAEHTRRTYAEMFRRARIELEGGTSVVLDATWSDLDARADAAELARSTSSRLSAFETRLDPASAATRIERRMAAGTDESDADTAVATAIRGVFAPWPDAIAVDTSGQPGTALAVLCTVLDAEV